MKRTIIIAALVMAASTSVFGQVSDRKSDKTGKAKEQVTALATELTNALVKGDTATLERILSDDFMSVSGLPDTKKMMIDYFKLNANNPDIEKLVAIEWDSSRAYIRFYDNVAVMVVPAMVKWRTPNNQPGEGNYMATLVAYNQKGRWQFVSAHCSPYKLQVTQPRQSK